MIIRKAYDNVKSDYTYLDDVRTESGLSEEVFFLCISELARQGTIELLPGFQLWNDGKKEYQIGADVFYGIQWIKDEPEKETAPSAFERLFEKITEITALMESTDKKKAADIIKTEFPEFSDMSKNTIKTNITSFPFLCRNMQEQGNLKSQLENARQAKEGVLTELDRINNELNNANSEITKLKDRLNKKDSEIARLNDVINKKESEMAMLEQRVNNELNKGVSDSDYTKPFEIIEQRLNELNDRLNKIESTDYQDIKQRDKDMVNKINKEVNKVGKWNVVKSGDYYRAFRKMGGKTVGVHLGREFKEDDATEKITAKGFPID